MTFDPVNKPEHYAAGAIECIDAMEAALGPAAVVNFCQGNAFKYAWRAGKKGDREQDLRKAAWYATKAAEILNRANPLAYETIIAVQGEVDDRPWFPAALAPAGTWLETRRNGSTQTRLCMRWSESQWTDWTGRTTLNSIVPPDEWRHRV